MGNIMGNIARSKNAWALLLLLLAGVVVGGFISSLTSGISWLGWLGYSQTFGLVEPLRLDLGVIVLTFGLTINISIGSIVGILIAILIYRLL
jgi:hypothetical protein